MKLRTTTPASKSLMTRSVLVAATIIFAVATPIQISQSVSADKYDDQIAALNQQVAAYQAQASQLNQQAQTLQAALAVLNNQIAGVQAQINLNQVKYDQLTSQIADTEKKIKDSQDALGTTIANLYVDSSVTPLELVASSKNISDFLDKQEYRNSVRDQLTSAIAQIKTLKTQLDQQKADTQKVLDQQNAQKAQLAAQQGEQQSILSQTQGQEAAYQQLVTTTQQKMADAAAAQRAYYQSLLSSSGGASAGVYGSFQWANLSPSNGAGGCSGGYSYCQSQDSVVDQWGLYNRECVSYVAWALQSRFHKYVGYFSGEGNAWEWASPHTKPNGSWNPVGSAMSYSGAYRVDTPQPGDAVILPQSGAFSPIGHAMIVETPADSNGWVHVSQFNFYGTGQYSTMDIKTTGVIFLRFPSA